MTAIAERAARTLSFEEELAEILGPPLGLDDPERDWRLDSNCKDDPDSMFPTSQEGVEIAKRVCGSCLVRSVCLQDALDNDEQYGVRGGQLMDPTPPRRKRSA